ncbi:MAG: drug/metabolite exporter YedA, partial [Phycisphaerae bacterium]
MPGSTAALPLGPPATAAPWRIVVAFAAIYVIWGSTYLAIRIGIGSVPPFVLASVRFLVAGAMLYVFARWRGAARPTAVQWRSTAIIGGLLLLCGNGGVVWSETRVSSGIAALLVAVVPLWMALFDWIVPGGQRPTRRGVAGLLVGLAGVVILVSQQSTRATERVDLLGAAALVFASMAWSAGSVYARVAPLPRSAELTTAMEMLCGGGLLAINAAATGQWSAVHWRAVTPASLGALVYLIIFGSIIGFSAYIWLLRVTTPARVATYAYVNPVVAMLLGCLLAGEPLTARTLVAAGVIISAVVLITTQRGARSVKGRAE